MAAPHDEDGFAPASNDAYTGMLSISLLALIGASVLLYLDYSQYGDKGPEPLKVLAPDQKLAANPIAKGKTPSKDFSVIPDKMELLQNTEQEATIKNGKAIEVMVEPPDMGLTAKLDEMKPSVTISAAAEAKEQVYKVILKSENDKTATLKVTVKKGKEVKE